jgi:hypothetical protein
MGELVVQQNKVPSTSRTFSKVRLVLGPDQLFALDLTSTLRGHDRQITAKSGRSAAQYRGLSPIFCPRFFRCLAKRRSRT